MIAITVTWDVKPEHADHFPTLVHDFTQACRTEPGCLWFEWSRSLDTPTRYVLLEAFRDADAGTTHVRSDHFHTAMTTLGQYLTTRPHIISVDTPQHGWDQLGEIHMPTD